MVHTALVLYVRRAAFLSGKRSFYYPLSVNRAITLPPSIIQRNIYTGTNIRGVSPGSRPSIVR